MATARSPEQPSSLWRPKIRRVWITLNELPLAFIAAAAAVIGTACLTSYFRREGFTPFDASAVIVPAAFAGALLALYLIGLVALAFAPALAESQLPPGTIRRVDMALAMTASASLTIAGVLAYSTLSCGRNLGWTEWIGSSVGAISVLLIGWRVVRYPAVSSRGSTPPNRLRLIYLGSMALMAFATLYVVVPLALAAIEVGRQLQQHLPVVGWADVVFFAAFVPAILLNSSFTNLPNATSRLIVGLMFVLAACIPLVFFGNNSLIPQKVAVLIGIRSDDIVRLLVPSGSCEVVQAAGNLAKDVGPKQVCRPGINTIDAQVRVRTSGRWLIEASAINDVPIKPTAVTLPDKDTEMAVRPPIAQGKERNACSR